MANAIVVSDQIIGANVYIANGNISAIAYTTQMTTSESGYQIVNRGYINAGDNTGSGTTTPNETGFSALMTIISISTAGESWSIN
jgi:hypothetical protein